MSKNHGALAVVDVPEMVKQELRRFFRSLGRDIPEINGDTDLIRGTGASSDEGVDFAIDLSDALGVEVPNDFNPFVHESGQRGRRFSELVERAREFVSAATEAVHDG
jgi:hypothetical protein